MIASAQRAARKNRGAVACGTRLVGSYPSPANQTLAEINPDRLNTCAIFDSASAQVAPRINLGGDSQQTDEG